MEPVTILIAARNAAATIGRCVKSVLREGGPILVVDDFSLDGTADAARDAGGRQVQVVRPAQRESLGRVRQTALQHVTTRFAMWVDADDEVMPGRAQRLLARLEQEGADLAFDAAELHDGQTGTHLRQLPIPAYLMRDPSGLRQFERNVLPSLGWPLVRTSWACRIGYDPRCHGVEDYDFQLRSSIEGVRIAYEPTAGYRQFAYGNSISRDLPARRQGVRVLLGKHAYAVVRARFAAAGHPAAVTNWALVAVAFYREDWTAAAAFLHEGAASIAEPGAVLEADGPCPYPEGWRLAFYRGTLALLTGDAGRARQELETAHRYAAAPESANNLGVVLARAGEHRRAARLFSDASLQFPAYLDARHNFGADEPRHVTTHPLRTAPARSEYPHQLAS